MNIRKSFKGILLLFVILSVFSLGSFVFTQQDGNNGDEDPLKNPLEEGTYIVRYYEDIIRRTMSGSMEITEEELDEYQSYYKMYYSNDRFQIKIMIERYEKLNNNDFHLIKRFMFNSIGSIVKEQTFSFSGELTSYTINNYDEDGRIIREAKYSGEGELRSETRFYYNMDGTKLRTEYYSRGRIVKKEIYGERNKLKKLYIYYYYPNGKLEKKEIYDGENTLQKVTIYDIEGEPLKKAYYEEGEIKEVVDLQASSNEEDNEEEMDMDSKYSSDDVYNVGIGPNIVVIKAMFEIAYNYMDSTEDLKIKDRVFSNNNIDFIFALLYSQGIKLDNELDKLVNKDSKNKCQLFYLWQYFKNQGWTFEKNYRETDIQRGDLLFFDGVIDVDDDGKRDPKTHIALVEDTSSSDGTITFIHSQGKNYDGIQRGSINLKAPGKGKLNSIIMVDGVKRRVTQLIAGIARPDYLDLKTNR
ncbi:MAG: hypothetical protein ACOCV8_03435 [Spirochaetota bacterium]